MRDPRDELRPTHSRDPHPMTELEARVARMEEEMKPGGLLPGQNPRRVPSIEDMALRWAEEHRLSFRDEAQREEYLQRWREVGEAFQVEGGPDLGQGPVFVSIGGDLSDEERARLVTEWNAAREGYADRPIRLVADEELRQTRGLVIINDQPMPVGIEKEIWDTRSLRPLLLGQAEVLNPGAHELALLQGRFEEERRRWQDGMADYEEDARLLGRPVTAENAEGFLQLFLQALGPSWSARAVHEADGEVQDFRHPSGLHFEVSSRVLAEISDAGDECPALLGAISIAAREAIIDGMTGLSLVDIKREGGGDSPFRYSARFVRAKKRDRSITQAIEEARSAREFLKPRAMPVPNWNEGQEAAARMLFSRSYGDLNREQRRKADRKAREARPPRGRARGGRGKAGSGNKRGRRG